MRGVRGLRDGDRGKGNKRYEILGPHHICRSEEEQGSEGGTRESKR